MAVIHEAARQHVVVDEPLPDSMRRSTLKIQHKVTGAESVINASDWNAEGGFYTQESYKLLSERPTIINQAISQVPAAVQLEIPSVEVMQTMKQEGLLKLAEDVGVADPRMFKDKASLILAINQQRTG